MTSLVYLENGQAVSKEVAITCYNQIPHFIFHKNCEGHYTCFNNKTTLFTHNKNALDMMDVAFSNSNLNHFSENEIELFKREDQLILSSLETKQFISMTRSCKGTYAYLMGSKKPLFHPDGTLLGLSGSYIDITHTSLANNLLLLIDIDKLWDPNCALFSYHVTPTL